MTPDRLLGGTALFLPLVAFSVAGVSELRHFRASGTKPWGLVAVGAAAADFAIFLGPGGMFMEPSLDWLNVLSRTMAVASLVIAGSGLFVRYARRRNAILVAVGGFLLAFIWFLNRLVA